MTNPRTVKLLIRSRKRSIIMSFAQLVLKPRWVDILHWWLPISGKTSKAFWRIKALHESQSLQLPLSRTSGMEINTEDWGKHKYYLLTGNFITIKPNWCNKLSDILQSQQQIPVPSVSMTKNPNRSLQGDSYCIAQPQQHCAKLWTLFWRLRMGIWNSVSCLTPWRSAYTPSRQQFPFPRLLVIVAKSRKMRWERFNSAAHNTQKCVLPCSANTVGMSADIQRGHVEVSSSCMKEPPGVEYQWAPWLT